MPRKAASPEQRSKARAQIRKAAADVYAENGIHGTTARAIAKKAEVSTGTIYSYFGGLTDLMQSLWREPVQVLESDLRAIASKQRNPEKRIRELLKTYIGFAESNPDVYRGAFLFVRPQTLPTPEVHPLTEFAFYNLLKEALREGQKAQVFRMGNTGHMAQCLWAGIHGSIALPINIDRAEFEPRRKLASKMVSTLMNGILR